MLSATVYHNTAVRYYRLAGGDNESSQNKIKIIIRIHTLHGLLLVASFTHLFLESIMFEMFLPLRKKKEAKYSEFQEEGNAIGLSNIKGKGTEVWH